MARWRRTGVFCWPRLLSVRAYGEGEEQVNDIPYGFGGDGGGCAWLCGTPLHKWPVAFYVLAVAADVAYVIGVEGLLPRVVMGPLTLLMGKCVLSLALFVVVMYIGVFAKGSRVHQWLKPVRSRACPLSHAFWLADIWRCIWPPTLRDSAARWG